MDAAQSTTEAVTIPCPPGRKPCMHFHCPEAAVDGSIWCEPHTTMRKALRYVGTERRLVTR